MKYTEKEKKHIEICIAFWKRIKRHNPANYKWDISNIKKKLEMWKYNFECPLCEVLHGANRECPRCPLDIGPKEDFNNMPCLVPGQPYRWLNGQMFRRGGHDIDKFHECCQDIIDRCKKALEE